MIDEFVNFMRLGQPAAASGQGFVGPANQFTAGASKHTGRLFGAASPALGVPAAFGGLVCFSNGQIVLNRGGLMGAV